MPLIAPVSALIYNPAGMAVAARYDVVRYCGKPGCIRLERSGRLDREAMATPCTADTVALAKSQRPSPLKYAPVSTSADHSISPFAAEILHDETDDARVVLVDNISTRLPWLTSVWMEPQSKAGCAAMKAEVTFTM